MSTTPIIADNAQEKISSIAGGGTGAFSLGGAVTGYVTFSSVYSDGQSFYYGAKDPTNGGTEVGIGTYHSSGDTISRDQIISSSNSGSAVNFSANTTFVYTTIPGEVLLPQHSVCEGRLTLTSNTPVTTSDVTGASTIYFTPFMGDCIGLWSGNGWLIYAFTQLSLTLSGGSGLMVGLPYDVFIYNNSGTLTLEYVAWSTGSARGTALGTQDGIYVKGGTPAHRYLGTFVPTASSTTEDSLLNRNLWNYYNRMSKQCAYSDSTSHSYTGTSWRQWNNNTSAKCKFVVGVVEETVLLYGFMELSSASNQYVYGGMGFNSTTSPIYYIGEYSASSAVDAFLQGLQGVLPSLGTNYIAPMEIANGASTTWSEATVNAALRC
jgi:hypothetical protein